MTFLYHFYAFVQTEQGNIRHTSGVLSRSARIADGKAYKEAVEFIAVHMGQTDTDKVVVASFNLLP